MQGICDILTLNVIRNFGKSLEFGRDWAKAIIDGAGHALTLASEKCDETVKNWNDLNYNTYKAVCCRQGVFRFHVSP